ncbi:MAG: LysR family transcriptional regulator [Paracoccaceae bacterium]
MQLSSADIRLLRVFDAVVRHRGFAGAQAELNVSQSTISTQITALEARAGITLCRRGRAGFQLTEKGTALHGSIVRFLAAADGFVTETAALRGALSGTLRIGLVDQVVTDPQFRLPQAIAALESRPNALRYELLQGSPQDLQARVSNGTLHLAIGSFPHKIAGLQYRALYSETNHLYCAQTHPIWAVPDADLTPELVAGLRTAGRSYWREDHWNNRDFPNSDAMAQGLEQQLVMILSGVFVGYLPDHSAARWVAEGRLRVILPDRYIYDCPFEIITRPDADTSPLATALYEELARLYDGDSSARPID